MRKMVDICCSNFGGLVTTLFFALLWKNTFAFFMLPTVIAACWVISCVTSDIRFGSHTAADELLQEYVYPTSFGGNVYRLVRYLEDFIPPELRTLPKGLRIAVLFGLVLAVIAPNLYLIYLVAGMVYAVFTSYREDAKECDAVYAAHKEWEQRQLKSPAVDNPETAGAASEEDSTPL